MSVRVAVERIGRGGVPRASGDALRLWLLEDAPAPGATSTVHLQGPHVPHERPAPARGWSVSFMPDALTPAPASGDGAPAPGTGRWFALLRQLGGATATAVSEADRQTLTRGLMLLRYELVRRAPGYALAARSALSLLLVDATRVLRLDQTPLPPLVVAVLDAIEPRFAEPLTQDELAGAVGQSPIGLGRALRQLTAVSPLRLTEERRMVEARRLLLGSDHKIEVIGQRVGYRDAGYFRRRFMHHHSVTPAVWRQLNR